MRRLLVASLLLATLLVLLITGRVLFDASEAAEFVATRNAPDWVSACLALHATGGIIALITGAWNAVARKPGSAGDARHRLAGRAYIGAVALSVSAACGLLPFVTSQWHGNIGIALLMLAWGLSTLMCLLAARWGKARIHRRWAVYSLALTWSAISLRLQILVLELATVGLFEYYYGLILWTCWLPNIVLAEIWLRCRCQML